jgi:hypothetical protein
VQVREPEATADRGPARGPRATLAELFPLRDVVAPWLVSRVVSIVVLLVAVNNPLIGSRFTQVGARWDGAFYLEIGRIGYGSVTKTFPDWPFFPGLPAVIRVLGHLGNDQALVFVVNQLAFLVALAGVYRVARRRSTARASAIAVWSLALFPASFVFSMTYPSALFLAGSVWAFALVETRIDVGAAVLAAGATLLRPNGIVVAVSLAVAVRTPRRILVVCGPAVAALGAWCWYCWDRTGDAFVFLTTKARWQEISAVGLVDGHAKWSVLPHAALALAAILAVVLARRRLPVAWIVFVALYLLPSLVTGMVGLARYANECFPPFVAAGDILERWSWRTRLLAFGASAFGLVAFAFVSGRYDLVP